MKLKFERLIRERFIPLFVIAISQVLVACGPHDRSPGKNDYARQLELCRTKLSEAEKKPIIGGGYVDMSRFGYPGSNVRFEDGQCGVDMLQLSFWWTGHEVIPDSPKFLNRSRMEIPESWGFFQVAAKLGNQRKANECKENIDLPGCSGFKGAVRTGFNKAEWPPELSVKLKNYPGLELWLEAQPPNIKNRYSVDNFVLTEWRRSDGTPRSINCWGLSPNNEAVKTQGIDQVSLALLVKDDLEKIELQGRLHHGVSCQVEYWDFGFNGGAARVSFSTEDLRAAPLALRAINQYLSDSIIRDE